MRFYTLTLVSAFLAFSSCNQQQKDARHEDARHEHAEINDIPTKNVSVKIKENPGPRPNIILLFSDDAGYADFGFQGSTHFKTPHLDQLAKEGVRLTQAYVTAAVCGPSRAGLLTGQYQQRFGFEENNVPGYMSPSGLDSLEMGLPVDLITLADYLKALGYRNTILGKWHMGGADRFHPFYRGFDEFYGFRGGARDYFPYSEEGQPHDPQNRLEEGFGQFNEHSGYLTDVLADKACTFMERNQDNPFFIFLSFNAVHTPMQATQEDLGQIIGLSGKRKQLAAMTLALDRACGKVLDKLKALNLDENTLVVFTNDNGGPTDASGASNYPLSGCKANHLEGGIRVPCLIRWPGKIQPNTVYHYPVSALDFLPTFIEAAGGDATSIPGLDGVDLLPYLQGSDKDRPHKILYWKKENRGAIREGDWKMLRFPDRPAELYNIANDMAEVRNLATQYPDKVKELYKKLFTWEMEMERPMWQLKRKYEGLAANRMDKYRKQVQE